MPTRILEMLFPDAELLALWKQVDLRDASVGYGGCCDVPPRHRLQTSFTTSWGSVAVKDSQQHPFLGSALDWRKVLHLKLHFFPKRSLYSMTAWYWGKGPVPCLDLGRLWGHIWPPGLSVGLTEVSASQFSFCLFLVVLSLILLGTDPNITPP